MALFLVGLGLFLAGVLCYKFGESINEGLGTLILVTGLISGLTGIALVLLAFWRALQQLQ